MNMITIPKPPKHDRITWTLIAQPDRKGHRFFVGEAQKIPGTIPRRFLSGELYLCDHSGTNPENCTDKMLRIDRSRSIVPSDIGFSIPVTDSISLGKLWTPASFIEAAWLCAEHGMRIAVQGAVYQISHILPPRKKGR